MKKLLFFALNSLFISNVFAIGEPISCIVPQYPGSREIVFTTEMERTNGDGSYFVTAKLPGSQHIASSGFWYEELKGSQLRKQRKNLSYYNGIDESEIKKVFVTIDGTRGLQLGNGIMQGYGKDGKLVAASYIAIEFNGRNQLQHQTYAGENDRTPGRLVPYPCTHADGSKI